jgi:hypothetical protein
MVPLPNALQEPPVQFSYYLAGQYLNNLENFFNLNKTLVLNGDAGTVSMCIQSALMFAFVETPRDEKQGRSIPYFKTQRLGITYIFLYSPFIIVSKSLFLSFLAFVGAAYSPALELFRYFSYTTNML